MREIKKYVRFYLPGRSKWSDQSPERLRNVAVSFNYDGKRLHTNAGVKVALCDWDKSKQRVKLSVKRSTEVNRYLDSIEQKINDIYFKAKADGVLIDTHHILKELRKDKNRERITFFGEWERYLKVQEARVKRSTMVSLRTSHRHFKDFIKGERIDFTDITPELMSNYVRYLLGIGHVNNTVHNNLKRLKTFMNYSRNIGLHDSIKYKQFSIPEKMGRIRFLEWEEVKQLMDYEPESELEQKVLDNFLFGCLTAMRFSDYHNLEKDAIVEIKFNGGADVYHAAHVRHVKTDNITVVPLLPEAMVIIERNRDLPGKFALPHLYSQLINDVIKVIGKKVGLTGKLPIDIFRGDKRETLYKEKWELLTTHLGRRTFISIAATKGIPINIVAAIAGQNPKTTMKHYAGVVDKERFERIVDGMRFG